MSEITPLARHLFLKDYTEHANLSQRVHINTRMCTESRWPFTGDLTPEEIVCMRDTYCGERQKPSYIQRRRDYDRLFHPLAGWNQRSIRDTHQNLLEVGRSAKDEEKLRVVPIGVNSEYGHRLSSFFDIASNMKPRQSLCEHNFYKTTPITDLPPIRDQSTRPPHPEVILKMIVN